MASEETTTVLIPPETQTTLEAEAERAGMSGEIAGGLLFGYPLDEQRHLVTGWVRPRPEVGFGTREFSIDQSRTSQQRKAARERDPRADYCGLWYIHRTPDRELADEEWVQAQAVVEDPDFPFRDLVCLVVCLYSGELNTYAAILTQYQAARGQMPHPAELQVIAGPSQAAGAPAEGATPPPEEATDWYTSPDALQRLETEREQLREKYEVDSGLAPQGRVIFRLSPRSGQTDMVFYIACGPGFPHRAPQAYLLAGGEPHPLRSPTLADWSPEHTLSEVADDVVGWQAELLEQRMVAAKRALERGDYGEAVDLLTRVLAVNPRTPRAARMLAQAQAGLERSVS